MTTTTAMNRRDFMRTGALAAATPLLSGVTDAGAAPSGRPFATCRKDVKLVGVYCNADEILNHPGYIDRLQEKLGCNVIILNGAGVRYPDDILRLAPYPRGKNTWFGPGYTDDDESIGRCADILHGRGMDMWLCGSGHVDHGIDDSLSPVGFDGTLFRHERVPPYAIEGGTGMCFQKPSVSRWEANAYPWICAQYDIDALYLTHHRYNIPSIYTRLWGCACDDCLRAADRLGYDFDRMRAAMLGLRRGLDSLTREQVGLAASRGYGLFDFFQTLSDGADVMAWLDFRAAAFTDTFSGINASIRSKTAGRCRFIVDTVGPTFMPLVGHDFKRFVGPVTDAFYSMAWVDYHYVSVAASWAHALCERVDGLDEPTALTAVYNLIGWEDIDLPRERIADLHIGRTGNEHSIPDFYRGFGKHLEPLMRHEYERGALLNTDNAPSYQTVFPHFWGGGPAEPLMEAIMEAGHDGYFFEISAEPFVARPDQG